MNSFPTTLLFTLVALVFVLILAWFAIRMLAQLGGARLGNNRMKVTHTLPLSSREKIVRLEYDETAYLLGVTAGGISLIAQNPVDPGSRDNQQVLN